MEVLIFENKMWHEIPQQDNPAFDYKYQNQRLSEGLIGRKQECIIVTKGQEYEQSCVGKSGYSVAFIPLTGDIIRKGLFWELDDAVLFANAIASNIVIYKTPPVPQLVKH